MSDTKPPEHQISITLTGAEATARLAMRLAPHLRQGDVVLIEGPIGAGKSHFCRSLIQHRLAEEGRSEDVPSPTYTLVQVYELEAVEIWHADLYRLTTPDEVFELGLDEAFEQAICLVEWPDRLGDTAPADALILRLIPGEDVGMRTALLSAHSARWDRVIADLAASGQGRA
ncbi:MAG: tRNA (adenosine(37)-N6)-threonylcarbamoyltransferase complex ATPase subunit type 1 TsaE [Albidovulum sp.]|uniref:tRNA (adenosine(37)-N6)-threonylcarbamoyltransferase complex ATPase subunit type 1 TsaE n=1 Tax=Albidovulum sp. TaxID=1872424 RepID=UPI003C811949